MNGIITGSDEQIKIWDAISNGNNHIIIEALAGTGKTTTLVESLNRLPSNESICFCAFNKHIAEELKKRIPNSKNASTIHSLGFGSIIRNFGNKPEVNANKSIEIAKKINSDLRKVDYNTIASIVSRYKNILYEPSSTMDVMDDLYDHDYTGDSPITEIVASIIIETLHQSRTIINMIDFDDMIWLPIVLDMEMRKFSTVMVDEAQDLNETQKEIVMRSSLGRIIICGDTNQAIYGFRGADYRSIENIRSKLNDRLITTLPLTITRRCSKAVTEMAARIVPQFRCFEDAREGHVSICGTEHIVAMCDYGDMIISRCNANIIRMAYALIKLNKRCFIIGRDIGSGLINLVNLLKAHDINDLIVKLKKYEDRQERILEEKNRSTDALHDKCESLRIIIEMCDTITELIDKINSLFTDNKVDNSIIMSTVHRAKGLEANRVFIIGTDKIPLKVKTKDSMIQEYNLAYVAATRAKNILIFENDIPMAFTVPINDLEF